MKKQKANRKRKKFVLLMVYCKETNDILGAYHTKKKALMMKRDRFFPKCWRVIRFTGWE